MSLEEQHLSRTRLELRRVMRRVVHAYEHARAGRRPDAMTRAKADLDDYAAIIETDVVMFLPPPEQTKPPCCAKCAAKDDAETQGMDVVFVPRKDDLI